LIRVRGIRLTSGQNECQADNNKKKLLWQHGRDSATSGETPSTKQERLGGTDELPLVRYFVRESNARNEPESQVGGRAGTRPYRVRYHSSFALENFFRTGS
jgi:hypothetical protein